MPPEVAAATAAAPSSAQVWIILASLFGTVISTVAMLWKTTHDQQHQLELYRLQHTFDREEREDKAREIRDALATEAAKTRDSVTATAGRVEETARDVRERLEGAAATALNTAQAALDGQTATLKGAIEVTATKADAAYHEANSVNLKIEKLHASHDKQAQVITDLLDKLARDPQWNGIERRHEPLRPRQPQPVPPTSGTPHEVVEAPVTVVPPGEAQ